MLQRLVVLHSRINTTTSVALHLRPTLISTTQLTRFISSIVSRPNFTEEYLINSCGFSPESALKTSKKIVLNESKTAELDSVISLFKSYGFTDSHISKLIAYHPQFLLASPEKTLKPKLEYFKSIGISGPNLGKLLSKDVHLLRRSLENSIIPSINFLRSLAPTDDGIAIILQRLKWSANLKDRMGKNVAILQDHGMLKSLISKLIIKSPQVLYLESNKLNASVFELKNMGFSPASNVFLSGLHVLVGMKKPIWDSKLEAYKSFGWSEDEVLSLFKKHPIVMSVSVKKINLAVNFFMNNLNWTRDDIAKNVVAINLSLEKRVFPRCYVLEILISKGLISFNGIGHALRVAEDVFLAKYVIKFQHEEPKLFEQYRIKLGTQDSSILPKMDLRRWNCRV